MSSLRFAQRWYQIIFCGLVAFGSQGVWNALNALGGGGTKEIATATLSNTVMNAASFALGWTTGGIVNMIGPRLGVSLGVCTCALFLTLFYCYAYHRTVPQWLVIVAAGVDGIGNVCMWAAMGTILMFYAKEREKGKAITIFNLIFNLGGVGGGLMAFLMNLKNEEDAKESFDETAASMSSTSYLAITCITYAALLLSFLLRDPHNYNSEQVQEKRKTQLVAKEELYGLLLSMRERVTRYMAPTYSMTIWHEILLYNWINASLHNVRTRAFNSTLYWSARMIFTLPLHMILDRVNRGVRTSGYYGALYLILLLTAATIVSSLIATLDAYRNSDRFYDFTELPTSLPILAMILYGAVDTVGQGLVIWMISEYPGANPHSVACHSGLFRSLQGFGQMIAWGLDLNHWMPYQFQFAVATILWALALPGLLLTLHRCISNVGPSPSSLTWLVAPAHVSYLGGMSTVRMLSSMAEIKEQITVHTPTSSVQSEDAESHSTISVLADASKVPHNSTPGSFRVSDKEMKKRTA